MKKQGNDKKQDEQRTKENIPSFSKRKHQSDEDLRREYGARSEYCVRCGCERPVGHYPHQ